VDSWSNHADNQRARYEYPSSAIRRRSHDTSELWRDPP
jgi:hypothetical protein